ncbi:hypothetical protein SAMN05660690_1781 [Geodermatophilus telluris]|uniref:YtxH-like protein n=1 Tax=Geodermatophilus telluris TaxID=1190417 RepID=A0A1G6MDC2_9ACTN|nr:hypothetical protein [Geodermatophilus telluris]SDC52986.1 hypothetical protein SAMN05660690_1781 [Geodermatophilus telluris]
MGKLTLGLGLGIGYVLGARAGRERYEQIVQATQGFLGRPEVQQTLEQARAAAPAPLQGSIDKLTQQASGGQGSGTRGSGTRGSGSGTSGTGTGTADTGRIEGEATLLGDVEAVVPPPPPVTSTDAHSQAGGPLPDPLVPPAKSGGTPGQA